MLTFGSSSDVTQPSRREITFLITSNGRSNSEFCCQRFIDNYTSAIDRKYYNTKMALNRLFDFKSKSSRDLTLRMYTTLYVAVSIFATVVCSNQPTVDVFFPSHAECGKSQPEEGQSTCMDCMITYIAKLDPSQYDIGWLRDEQQISHNEFISQSFAPHFSVKVIYDAHEKYGGDYEIYRMWISNVTRTDSNTYTCRLEYTLDGFKSTVSRDLDLTVIYFPHEIYPVCSSNSQSFVFNVDVDMVFQCLSEQGEPDVNLEWTYDLKVGDKIETNIAPANDVPQDDLAILKVVYTTAAEIFDGVIFVCTLTSDAFPDKSRTCSIGPLKIQYNQGQNPTEPPDFTTSPTTIQTTSVILKSDSTMSVPEDDTTTPGSTIITDVTTSFIPEATTEMSTNALFLTSFTQSTLDSNVPTTQRSTTPELMHSSVPTSSATFTTSGHSTAELTTRSQRTSPGKSVVTPIGTTVTVENIQSTKIMDKTDNGNITIGSGKGSNSGNMNTTALIAGMSVAIAICAFLLLLVFLRWRKTKEKLKRQGELSHLPSMNYADLQYKYDSNGHAAYYQDVNDEIPKYPQGQRLQGQRLQVSPGVMYDTNTPATLPYNERHIPQGATLQMIRPYPLGPPPDGPLLGRSHPHINNHTYSELSPPKLPPNRPTSMVPCTNPVYDRTLHDPYYYKVQPTPSAPAMEAVDPSQQGIVANILYQSDSNTCIMQPFVEINRNGGSHKANEEIYQTVS